MSKVSERFEELAAEHGFSDAAIDYCLEWYCDDELQGLFIYMTEYGYGARQMMQEELDEFLAWHEITQEEFEDFRGHIMQDAAFEGYLVFGECVG